MVHCLSQKKPDRCINQQRQSPDTIENNPSIRKFSALISLIFFSHLRIDSGKAT